MNFGFWIADFRLGIKRKSRRRWVRWRDSFSDNRKSKIKNLKWAGCFAICVALAVCAARVEAQQPKKIARVGFLSAASASSQVPRLIVFRDSLRELGYVEGQNITVEYRYLEGKRDRLPELVAELVRLKVDVIVTGGPQATRAAKEITGTIPIVMAQDNDPVGNGFVTSLARPGRNITGLTNTSPELSGKWLELLKETVPRLSRVAALGNSNTPGNAQALRETELAAGAFGVKLQYLDVQNPNDIESAFRAASERRADAVLVLPNPVIVSHRAQVADQAVKSRLPAIYFQTEFVENGGLMFYGPNLLDLFRRAAVYVDKILKGTKPAELPVEQPTKFEFVINLEAAKQIRLTIPPSVLARADRVIR
ncbi:MAG TPA: ABC transporter substrate-binding protein [Candidatus Binatia bacterium]|nr:ABC transporter substrate-binding protein [Candidatus Binatia bacterium]